MVQFEGELSASRVTVTRKELARHLLSLDVIFPSQRLTEDQMTLRYQIFYDDLRHLTEPELATACSRYRRDPVNNFGPTPGKLLKLT